MRAKKVAVIASAPSPRREAASRRLIEATLDCIATLGLRETTVPDIAARAGMAVGSISQYFAGKEALYTAALDAMAREFAERVADRVAAAGPSPARRLCAYVDAYFDVRTGQRRKVAVWFAFWAEVQAQPQYQAVCAGHDRAHDALVESLVSDLVGPAHSAAQARLLTSCCYGLWLELLTAHPRPSREALHALAYQQLAALFPAHAGEFAQTE